MSNLARIIPLTLKQANRQIDLWHRHSTQVRGCRFCLGVTNDDGVLVGVAVVGRPVSRVLDDGLSAEITRVATDGTRNACSKLYGACRRAAQAMGYLRIYTYTLQRETGSSLRAAGFRQVGKVQGRQWSCPSRPRKSNPIQDKICWEG